MKQPPHPTTTATTAQSASDVLQYVASIFARGDATLAEVRTVDVMLKIDQRPEIAFAQIVKGKVQAVSSASTCRLSEHHRKAGGDRARLHPDPQDRHPARCATATTSPGAVRSKAARASRSTGTRAARGRRANEAGEHQLEVERQPWRSSPSCSARSCELPRIEPQAAPSEAADQEATATRASRQHGPRVAASTSSVPTDSALRRSDHASGTLRSARRPVVVPIKRRQIAFIAAASRAGHPKRTR